jgi:hypothetical protein
VTLSSRLARLEAAAPPPVEFDGPMGEDEMEWNRLFAESLQRLLSTMPDRYAARVVVALQGGDWWPDPVARRAVKMTLQVIPRADPSWFPWAWRGWIMCCGSLQGPFALAAETCELLDAHPNTEFEWYDCESCGYEVGERPSSEWRAYSGSRSRCLQALQQPDWARERGIRCPHPPPCPAAVETGGRATL